MSSIFFTNATRFFFLAAIQGLILRNIGAGWESFPYVNIFIYPLFIFLLPFNIPRPFEILLGFLLGLSVDAFYNSPGVHASATVFIAFMRPMVFGILEPRAGYNVNYSPTWRRMGTAWFVKYICLMLLLHLFFYFAVEAFTPVYFLLILKKTFFSFILSIVVIFMIHLIIKPID